MAKQTKGRVVALSGAAVVLASCVGSPLTVEGSRWAAPGGPRVSITEGIRFLIIGPEPSSVQQESWEFAIQPEQGVMLRHPAKELTAFRIQGTWQGAEPLGPFYCSGASLCFADTNEDSRFEFQCRGQQQVFSYAAAAAAVAGGPPQYAAQPTTPRRLAVAPYYITRCEEITPIEYAAAERSRLPTLPVSIAFVLEGDAIRATATTSFVGGAQPIATTTTPIAQAGETRVEILGQAFAVRSEGGRALTQVVAVDPERVFEEGSSELGNPK